MTDAGQWSVDTLPVDSTLYDVWVGADGSAILVGAFVIMCRTGRGRWERAKLRGQLQYMAVAGIGSVRIAVGYPHSCVVSSDRGARWQNRAVGARSKLDSIACISEQRIFVAGEDGTYVTNDGGKKFTRAGDMRYVALAETGLFGVSSDWNPVLHVWDELSGWRAVGPLPDRTKQLVAAGEVLIHVGTSVHRSVDGGVTWVKTIPHRKKVYLIAAAANITGRVVVVGYDGLIAVSEDFGVTWQEHRPTDRNLRGVCIAPDEEIWAVGDDGVLVRSGIDAARDVAVEVAPALPDDGIAIGAVLRQPAPLPAWCEPEAATKPVHVAPVTAAVFLDDKRAVTGDSSGRLARLSRKPDGRWANKIAELGKPITGLAAIGDNVFAIVGAKLQLLDGASVRTPGTVTCIAARANRLAAGGSNVVSTWLYDDKLGKRVDIEVAGELVNLDVSLDGTHVVCIVGDRVITHDATTGKPMSSFRRRNARVARFTRDGKRLYLANEINCVAVVSAAKGGGKDSLNILHRPWAVATSPTVSMVAVLSHGDDLDVFDPTSEAFVLSWRGDATTLCGAPRTEDVKPAPVSRIPDQALLTAVAVSDGGSVLVGDVTGEVAIFDARTLALHRAGSPRSTRVQGALEPALVDVCIVAFGRSDDARVLALGADQRIRIIDPDTGEVCAGPRTDLANVEALHGIGDMIVASTKDGWIGLHAQTGARCWTASFAVRGPVAHRGALYGFESRRSYPAGERINHELFRLDAATGVVTKVPLPAPPRADQPDGYGSSIEATETGFLASFTHADRTESTVLLDVERGSAVELDVRAVVADPMGRYVLANADTWQIRDTRDPAWPIIARPTVPAGDVIPLVDAGLFVSIDKRAHHLAFHDFEGALVRRIGGMGLLTRVFATARAEAIVVCSDVVRRYAVPTRAARTR